MERVVMLVDMDCFYVQVEQKLDPSIRDKPCAVVQYKRWHGGSLIAVGYKARKFGIKRGMTGDEAQKLCPDLTLARVTETRGKANLTKYRTASAEVMKSLARFSGHLERASIDEAYLDVTSAVDKRMKTMPFSALNADMLKSTHIVGWEETNQETHVNAPDDTDNEKEKMDDDIAGDDGHKIDDDIDVNSLVTAAAEAEMLEIDKHTHKCGGDTTDSSTQPVVDQEARLDEKSQSVERWLSSSLDEGSIRLAYGAVIANEIRAAMLKDTGFTCSAGISHNKVLAKLACGFHKPNQQTVLCMSSVAQLFSVLPLTKLRNLGGKLGASVAEKLSATYVGDLCQYTQQKLQEEFGDKTGHWLFNVCRGSDSEPVRPRQLTKSIGCSKNFTGTAKLICHEQIKYWFLKFAEEICERLSADMAENSRVAQHLSIHYKFEDWSGASRSCALAQYDVDHIAHSAYMALLRGRDITPSTCSPSETPGPTQWSPPIVNLGMSASQFVALPPQSIDRFLTAEKDNEQQTADTMISQQKRQAHTNHTEQREQQDILNFFPKRAKTGSDAAVDDDTGDVTSTSTCDVQDEQQHVLCSKCQREVTACDMQEHQDYHMALQLQQEMNAASNISSWSSGSNIHIRREERTEHDERTASASRRFGSNIRDYFQ